MAWGSSTMFCTFAAIATMYIVYTLCTVYRYTRADYPISVDYCIYTHPFCTFSIISFFVFFCMLLLLLLHCKFLHVGQIKEIWIWIWIWTSLLSTKPASISSWDMPSAMSIGKNSKWKSLISSSEVHNLSIKLMGALESPDLKIHFLPLLEACINLLVVLMWVTILVYKNAGQLPDYWWEFDITKVELICKKVYVYQRN